MTIKKKRIIIKTIKKYKNFFTTSGKKNLIFKFFSYDSFFFLSFFTIGSRFYYFLQVKYRLPIRKNCALKLSKQIKPYRSSPCLPISMQVRYYYSLYYTTLQFILYNLFSLALMQLLKQKLRFIWIFQYKSHLNFRNKISFPAGAFLITSLYC